MRVYLVRGSSFSAVNSGGEPADPVTDRRRRLMKMQAKVGKVCAPNEPAAKHRRKLQHDGHGEPRRNLLPVYVDRSTAAAVVAEASRRGLARGALVGRLIETIADDGLFDAILGPVK